MTLRHVLGVAAIAGGAVAGCCRHRDGVHVPSAACIDATDDGVRKAVDAWVAEMEEELREREPRFYSGAGMWRNVAPIDWVAWLIERDAGIGALEVGIVRALGDAESWPVRARHGGWYVALSWRIGELWRSAERNEEAYYAWRTTPNAAEEVDQEQAASCGTCLPRDTGIRRPARAGVEGAFGACVRLTERRGCVDSYAEQCASWLRERGAWPVGVGDISRLPRCEPQPGEAATAAPEMSTNKQLPREAPRAE